MRKKQPMRLWADVPDSERVDREFIEDCNGANPDHVREQAEKTPWKKDYKAPEQVAAAWVERKLSALNRPDGCAAAIRWGSSERWKRCSGRVAPDNQFCYHHGGLHPPKIVYVKVVPDPRVLEDRNERRRQAWLRKRQEADDALAALDAKKAGP